MERKRAKLSKVCVSVIVILSVILAVFSVMNTYNQGKSDSSGYANTNIEGSTVADSSKDNYMGGIGMDVNSYIAQKNYASDPNWVAITNATQLQEFLVGTSATYTGKNGYLVSNIDNFNWDSLSADAAYLAPRITFSRQFDGCGYTVRFTGQSTKIVVDSWGSGWSGWDGTKVIAEPDTIKAGAVVNETTEGFLTPSPYKSAAFGGFVSILAGGSLTNFKFVIDSSHRFIHDKGTVADTFMSVGGGLVGYQTGGKIDNVVVELAANRQIGATHAEYGCGDRADNTSINGLVVGAISGGAISNATAILQPGSMVASMAFSYKPNNKKAAAYAGGIVGYVKRCDKITNVSLYGNGGEVRAFSGHAKADSSKEDDAHEYAGGIAACINPNSTISITGAKVVGNMNCLSTSDTKVNITRIKNIGVAKGTQPTPMLYVDAQNGTNTDGIDGVNDRTRGYTDNKDKIILNTQNNVALYFDKNTDGAVRLFIPQNNIVWSIFNQRKVSDLITGADYEKLVFEVPQAAQITADKNGDRITSIELGTSGAGEVGIYKRDPNGEDMDAAFDSAGNLTTSISWTEMSDQTRAARAGVDPGVNGENAPALYYDGTTYVIKIKVGVYNSSGNLEQRLFSGDGLNIRNIGDLKNAQSSFNGRPVKLYCDSDVAYIDEQRRIIIMVNNLKDGDMQKTLTIKKRYIWVDINKDYMDIRDGKVTIFEGATVKFGKVENDSNTGLVKNDEVQDYIMWQDTRYTEADTITLNVAGRQLLRPSTNNYILKHRVYWGDSWYDEDLGSYFSANVAPHRINVASGIYINGAAATNGVYEIKNARTDNAEYNETKRKIVVTARVNDNHFTAKRVVFKDANGNEVKTYLNQIGGSEQNIVWKRANGTEIIGDDWRSVEGLITTELYINDSTIKSIVFEDYNETLYTVSVNDGKSTTTKTDYRYGDRVYLNAQAAASGMSFVGWQREKDGSFVSYLPSYSLKVTEDFNVTAIYESTEGKTWKHEYYGRYGKLQRRAVAVDERPIADYKLPVTLGWEFKTWEATVNHATKTVEFHAVFAKRSENPSVTYPKEPTVNLIWIEGTSAELKEIEYGAPIKLEANKTYLVDYTEVVVGEEDLIIYAIVDNMRIEEVINPNNKPIVEKTASMDYHTFIWNNGIANDNKDVYYINISFVYGEENAFYGEDDRPAISMDGFTANDITEYNRYGNVYQVIMVITAQEIECRFGNDSEISTFLTVDGYTFDSIMIFRRHSSDTTTVY